MNISNSNLVRQTSNDGMNTIMFESGKHLGYADGYSYGYDDGVKNGKIELANQLSKQLLELKVNHTVIDISTVISMVEAHKSL